MNILPAIDQPFRFTKGFFVTWALLVAAALWFLGKVDMGPWYSAVGFVLFVPFLLTFAVYGPVLIFKAARASGHRGREVLRACAEVLVFGVVLFGGLLLCGQYTEHSARLFAWAFAPLVSLYLAWRLRRPETGEPVSPTHRRAPLTTNNLQNSRFHGLCSGPRNDPLQKHS